MKAHFYIFSESFHHNNEFSASEIESKVMTLAKDVILITHYKDSNELYVNYKTLYPQLFYLHFTVYDFICDPHAVKKEVDRDLINTFQRIFDKATETNIDSDEVKTELFQWADESDCHALIAFHRINGIDENHQIIYNVGGWQNFRRYYLGLFPNNNTFFIEECKKYFPNLFFHENTKTSVNKILDDFAQAIIWNLACLNDVFYLYKDKTFVNESVKYQAFTSECSLPESAASKDSNDAKEALTFSFTDKSGNTQQVVCYPHLRLSKSDKPGDSHYYHNRIYFHESIPLIEKGKLLVAHIGKHRD